MDAYTFSSGKSLNKGYRNDWFKRLEEEAEKELERQAEENQKKNAAKTTPEKFAMIGKTVQDAAGGVGNFIKDAAVDLYETGKSSVEGIHDVAEGQIAAGKLGKNTEEVNRLNQERGKYMDTLKDEDYDKPEVKAKLLQMQEAVEKVQNGVDPNVAREMQESQDVDSTKVAADTAETFLNVATAGTGLGIKALAKQGVKSGVKLGAKEVAKAGAKDVIGATMRGAGEGAIFSGAAGLTDAISEDMTAEEAVANVGKSAAFGAVLGGASGGIGRAVDVKKNNKAFDAQEAAKATEQAEIAAVGDGVDDVLESVKNPLKDLSDDDLNGQLDEFLDGGGRTGDVAADYGRIQGIKDELSARERNNYFANGGVDADTARKQLEEFDSGKIPETAMRPAKPVESIDEVIQREDIPVEIKTAAQEVATDRQMVEQQMEGLMSPQTRTQEVSRLDEQYDMQVKELTQKYASLEQPVKGKDTTVNQTVDGQRLSGDYKSDVRFKMAKDRLDEDYQNSIAELDMLEAADAEEVGKFQGILDTLDQREQNIILDTRNLMKSAPDQFLDIDEAEASAIREGLERQLADAERFTTPGGVVSEVATSPDPVKSFESNEDAVPAFQKEVSKEIDSIPDTSIQDNFKNITGSKLAALRVMSPSQVLEAMGLRGKDLDLHSNILKAESAVNIANKADSEILSNIAQVLPNDKTAQMQIIDYLEGKRQTLSAIPDKQAADMIRKWLDDKRAGIKEMGHETMDDYFPHMFDKKNPDVQRLFKGKTTGDISFGNIKQRISDGDDYSRDVMNVLTTYATSFNRKKFLEPALKPLDDIKKQVELSDAEAKWVDGYIEQLKGFDKSTIGDAYNQFMDNVFQKTGIMKGQVGKNHYTQTLGTQRMISAGATMGLNPGTAIRNTTQMVNTVAGIGPRYATIGMMDGTRALRAGPGSVEWKELERVGIMDGGVSQNYFDAIASTGVQGKIAKSRDASVKGLMSMIRGTDIALRTQAYYGAKALATKQGLTGEAAENFAIRKVIDTQFVTSRVDMPLAFNGQGVRSLTQLATFSGKQAGFLKRMGIKMVKGDDGQGFKMQDAGAVLSGVITAAIATEALKPLMGFKEEEWIPFYDQVAPFVPEGALNAVGLEKPTGDSMYRSPLVRLLAGDGKGKMGLIEGIQTGDVSEVIKDQWSAIIPAGTQMKKTWEGLTTTMDGTSRNDKGAIRFMQDQGTTSDKYFGLVDLPVNNELKAGLFGQYSTEAGRNWIEKGFPTLSEKQTEKVEQQGSREQQELYADYYTATKNIDYENANGKGRQAAYDAAKAKALEGNANGAATIAAEYNAAVDRAMAEFWSKHDTLPEDLRTEMHNNLRIKVNKLLDNAKDE